MYENDSLFTLTLIERLGVLAISAALTVLTFVALWRFVNGMSLWLRLVCALGALVIFMWLSPQVYYTYYIFIFKTLPWQIVIGLPPLLDELFRTLTFTSEANLSRHGQGVLGWALILLAALQPKISARWPERKT